MMRSLFSSVAGLKAHQTKMDVIGNNIANVNTVAYKSQSVTFSDMFYQTTQTATGANAETNTGGQNAMQIGLGSQLNSISTDVTGEGGSETTGNGLDLKINGSSFFIIQSGGTNYFTKAGNFTTDSLGNLVTQSGGYVMGYAAALNSSGDYELQTDQLRPLSVYGSEYMTTSPAQTTEVTMSGNINPEDDAFSSDGSGYLTTLLNVYDSLGNLYSVQVQVTQTSTSEYTLTTTGKVFSGSNEVSTLTASGSTTLTFNTTTGLLTSDDSFDLTFTSTDSRADALVETINVDVSSLTCYGSSTTLDSARGDSDGLGAGKPVGTMTSVGIDTSGRIVAAYDNGDNVVIGQIAVTTFINPSGLEKVGDNLFAATLNSGDFNGIGSTIDSLGESFSTGTLEMSNVDLADEFTSMITTQRGFQANSRVITTSDTMLEELINLKR